MRDLPWIVFGSAAALPLGLAYGHWLAIELFGVNVPLMIIGLWQARQHLSKPKQE